MITSKEILDQIEESDLTYPFLSVPNELWRRTNCTELYKHPEFNTRKPGSPPKAPSSLNSNLAILFGMVAGGSGMMFFVGSLPSLFSGKGDMGEIALGLGLTFAISLFVWYLFYEDAKSDEQKHSEVMRDYNKVQIEYDIAVHSYLRELERLKSYSIDQLRVNLQRSYYSKVTEAASLSRDSYAEGKCELVLFNHLKEYFGERIKKGITIDLEGEDRLYLPDMVYINEVNGICIDIELDEMHSSQTGEVIHGVDSLHDEARNEFFNDLGWIVIRFPEAMMSYCLDDCLAALVAVVDIYDPDHGYGQIEFERKLKTFERWTMNGTGAMEEVESV